MRVPKLLLFHRDNKSIKLKQRHQRNDTVLNQLLVILKKRMKTNQLYLTGCLKNVVKFYLNYLIVLAMSMMLKGLLIELKVLLEAK